MKFVKPFIPLINSIFNQLGKLARRTMFFSFFNDCFQINYRMIFTIFSPYKSVLGADDRSGPFPNFLKDVAMVTIFLSKLYKIIADFFTHSRIISGSAGPIFTSLHHLVNYRWSIRPSLYFLFILRDVTVVTNMHVYFFTFFASTSWWIKIYIILWQNSLPLYLSHWHSKTEWNIAHLRTYVTVLGENLAYTLSLVVLSFRNAMSIGTPTGGLTAVMTMLRLT